MDNQLKFKAGEKREFEYNVFKHTATDTIVVTSASWELSKRGTAVESGDCTISGTAISCVVPFETAGDYMLRVKAVIPPETIIEDLLVKVI